MPLPICDVPVEHIVAVWPHVRGYIASVLERDGSGRFETSDILAALLRGEAKLWVAWDADRKTAAAAVITEIIVYPRLSECRVWIVGGRPGSLKSWVYATRDMIEDYARAQGCAFISGAMRRGWIRIGGPGWQPTGMSFDKDLRDGK